MFGRDVLTSMTASISSFNFLFSDWISFGADRDAVCLSFVVDICFAIAEAQAVSVRHSPRIFNAPPIDDSTGRVYETNCGAELSMVQHE